MWKGTQILDTKTMEFMFLTLLSILGFCYILHKLINNGSTDKCHFPPGRKGWPLFGETLEYLSAAKNGFPENFIQERIKIYSSKIFKTSLFFEPMAMFCSAEGNKLLFSNENKLVQSWLPSTLSKIILFSDKLTDSTIRLRKVVFPSLKPDALQMYVGTMDRVIKQHLETCWNSFEEVKVLPLAKNCSFSIACRLFLNVEDDEIIDQLLEPINHVLSGVVSLPINLPGTKFNRAIKASREVRRKIQGMVKERKIEVLEKKGMGKQDLMSILLTEKYEDGEFFNDEDIAATLFGLLVGAYDNVSITIACVMKFLAELPRVHEEALKEQMEITNSNGEREELKWEDTRKMKYLRNVTSETLRLMPPTSGAFKEAITDFTYQGFHIPKGWKIHWNPYATHKNPEYFMNPEKFDPTRFEDTQVPYSYVPFGGGPRMCPGAEYARLLVLIFIHNVVKQFKWEKVITDEKWRLDPFLQPVHGLPVRLHKLKD